MTKGPTKGSERDDFGGKDRLEKKKIKENRRNVQGRGASKE